MLIELRYPKLNPQSSAGPSRRPPSNWAVNHRSRLAAAPGASASLMRRPAGLYVAPPFTERGGIGNGRSSPWPVRPI